MSHFSRIKTQIKEKEFLLKALDDMGFKAEEGEFELKGFAGERARVEIRVPLRLSGDIGFRHSAEGYEIIADWWGVRGVKQTEFTQKLTQRYAYQAARAKLEAQGFTLVEEQQEKNQIRLVMRRLA